MFHKTSSIETFPGYEREDGRERISQFSVKRFCLGLPKTFIGEHFIASINSGIEKIYV